MIEPIKDRGELGDRGELEDGKRECETCEFRGGHGSAHCRPLAGLPLWYSSRAALEGRIANLEVERDGLRTALDDARRGVEPPPSPPGGGRARPYLERIAELERERDAAIAPAAEERAARAGLEEQLAEAEGRRDELRAEGARARAEVARLESELGGLRHSLDETGAELDECLKELGEARAAARVAQADAEQERDQLREGLREMLALIDANKSSYYGIESRREFRATLARLRALLGEARPPRLPEVKPQFPAPDVEGCREAPTARSSGVRQARLSLPRGGVSTEL